MESGRTRLLGAVVISMFVLSILGIKSLPQDYVSFAQDHGKILNVKAFGARGDGVADDTSAIQSAINAAQAGDTIYFPSGTYNVSNFMLKNRSGLSFAGDGENSIIKQKAGAARIATIEQSRDILISNLAFDANGIASYGGLVFYAVTGVRIENNKFFDSAQKPWGQTDRNSFNFARGVSPSRDIRITHNTIEDVQLDFDHAQHVVVDGNVVKRSGKTGGIGIYTVGDHAIAEDFQIINNTVIDPLGAGFSIGLDPPTDRGCIFRRITVADNQVIRTSTAGYGIRIGTPDNSKKTAEIVFDDLTIKNNRLRINATAPEPERLIFANTSTTAGIVFNRLTVSGNQLENQVRGGKGYAIELRRIQHSSVVGNSVKGFPNGISLKGDLIGNEVADNAVEASGIAYQFEDSLGGNKAANNKVLGQPQVKWQLRNLNSSDALGPEQSRG